MPPAQGAADNLPLPVGTDDQQGKDNGGPGHPRLSNHRQFAAVDPVGQYAGPGADNQHRNSADAHGRAGEQGVAVGQLQGQPADGQHLQPLGADGKEVAQPDIAEVPILAGYGKSPQAGQPAAAGAVGGGGFRPVGGRGSFRPVGGGRFGPGGFSSH